ncbi:unnamed protein product [Zymoseptoria tritici ST99CH_3D7]|uniref:Cytochrome c oxidase subunit 8, mitochondrial n=2 Tax=Zymoseptoria tritici TaxID=1047171 RepID=A0A1X7S9G1_ZYMT9|nr:unnamed protein product [Zymoseptoria tritici ST99CH_3D7]
MEETRAVVEVVVCGENWPQSRACPKPFRELPSLSDLEPELSLLQRSTPIEDYTLLSTNSKMFSRAATRAPATLSRRAFSTTRAQFASPYHYPEGPRTNIPFNPLTRFFWLRYWGFMAVGFGAPFGIAVWQTMKNK